MKRTIAVSLVFILAIAFRPEENNEDLIRKSFEQYRTFLYNQNGEGAVSLLDRNTIRYYGDIAELARSADSLKVESLSLIDKLTVLIIRQRASREEILTFDGTSLLVYAIDKGMIEKKSLARLTIGSITIENNFAKARIVFDGIESPSFLHFCKEEGQWKYDLTSSFQVGLPALQKLAKELTERGLINAMLAVGAKDTTVRNPWNPIQ